MRHVERELAYLAVAWENQPLQVSDASTSSPKTARHHRLQQGLVSSSQRYQWDEMRLGPAYPVGGGVFGPPQPHSPADRAARVADKPAR